MSKTNRSTKITIIDNSLEIDQIVREIGFNSSIVLKTNKTALDLFEKGYKTDILIVDLDGINDMCSFEMTKKLRSKNNKQIIIFITKTKDFMLERKAFECGALTIIQKPFKNNELLYWLKSAEDLISFRKSALKAIA